MALRRSLRQILAQTAGEQARRHTPAQSAVDVSTPGTITTTRRRRGTANNSNSDNDDHQQEHVKSEQERDETTPDEPETKVKRPKKSENNGSKSSKASEQVKKFPVFPGWEAAYRAIEARRQPKSLLDGGKYAHAPVDDMEPQIPFDSRGSNFVVLFSSIISSQTKDSATITVVNKVKQRHITHWSIQNLPFRRREDEQLIITIGFSEYKEKLQELYASKGYDIEKSPTIYQYFDELADIVLKGILYQHQKSKSLRRIARNLAIKECEYIMRSVLSLYSKLKKLDTTEFGKLYDKLRVEEFVVSAPFVLNNKLSGPLKTGIAEEKEFNYKDAALKCDLMRNDVVACMHMGKIKSDLVDIKNGIKKLDQSEKVSPLIVNALTASGFEELLKSEKDLNTEAVKDLLLARVLFLVVKSTIRTLDTLLICGTYHWMLGTRPNVVEDKNTYEMIDILSKIQSPNQLVALSIFKTKSLLETEVLGLTKSCIERASEKLSEEFGISPSTSQTLPAYLNKVVLNMDFTSLTIPSTIEEIQTFPGVGPKIGLIYMGFLGQPVGIPVDRHVNRISSRLGITPRNKKPGGRPMEAEDTRKYLEETLSLSDWPTFNPVLVGWGQVGPCKADPECKKCPVNNLCPTGGGPNVRNGWKWAW